MTWELLGMPSPATLAGARVQAHWAAQIAAAAGNTWASPQPDHSHTALTWNDERQTLEGAVTDPPRAFCCGLAPADLSLVLRDEHGRRVAEASLDGRSLDDGMDWLAWAISSSLGKDTDTKPRRPDHDLPPHELADDGRFRLRPAPAFEELARWFANADGVLRAFSNRTAGAGPVLCWPHHFDIATLVQIDDTGDADRDRSIGVGLSPGDGHYSEPYYYVMPWPYPDAASLPELEEPGFWHTEGWTGAVLRAASVVALGTPAAQQSRVEAFIEAATAAAHAALDAG